MEKSKIQVAVLEQKLKRQGTAQLQKRLEGNGLSDTEKQAISRILTARGLAVKALEEATIEASTESEVTESDVIESKPTKGKEKLKKVAKPKKVAVASDEPQDEMIGKRVSFLPHHHTKQVKDMNERLEGVVIKVNISDEDNKKYYRIKVPEVGLFWKQATAIAIVK